MGQAKVFLTGRISNDPKIYGEGSKTRLLLNVACNYLVAADDGSKEQRTDFHSLVIWGENRVKSLKPWLLKGRLVEVTGTLQNFERRDYNGEWVRKDTTIRVNTVEFLDKKPDNVQTETPAAKGPGTVSNEAMSQMAAMMQQMMQQMTAQPVTKVPDEAPY